MKGINKTDRFVGCTHFGHESVIIFERKRFNSIVEHDMFLVDLINESLNTESTLYHLGDVGDPSFMRFIKAKKKVLVKGNHDILSDDVYLKYFDEVYDHPIFINKRVLLSHEPKIKDSDILNIHAHMHSAIMYEQITEGSYFNAGVHMSMNPRDKRPLNKRSGYYILKGSDIDKLIVRIKKNSTKFLEEAYAESYYFIGNREGVVKKKNGTIDIEKSKEERRRIGLE